MTTSVSRTGDAARQDIQSAEVFRSITDAFGDALIVVDAHQRIVLFNKAAGRMFDYSPDEVIGEHLNLLLPEPYRGDHDRYVEDFNAHGRGHLMLASARSSVQGRRRDGSTFPAEISLSAVEIGGESMAAAAVRDVSSRMAMERALAASEQRFRATFEESPVAMTLVTLDGLFATGNKAFADQMGYSLAEMEGSPMDDLVSPEDRETLHKSLGAVLAGERSTARLAVRVQRRDGIPLTIDLFLAPVTDDDDRPSYIIGQAIDVTERVEAQARLRELLQSKDDLIASISHELRTPLTSLVGFAKILDEELSDLSAAERDEMIRLMVSESVDLTNIVEDLLVAARAESGDLSVAEVSVDLHAQAAQVLETWNRPDLEQIEFVGSPAWAVADPARVRQILRNLISNAFRYGDGGIKVEQRDDPVSIRLVVSNRGEPIPEPDRDRIFEPYQRAHRLRGVTASMGLGLSISRYLARRMNGDLTYSGESGRNIFELTLPRLDLFEGEIGASGL